MVQLDINSGTKLLPDVLNEWVNERKERKDWNESEVQTIERAGKIGGAILDSTSTRSTKRQHVGERNWQRLSVEFVPLSQQMRDIVIVNLNNFEKPRDIDDNYAEPEDEPIGASTWHRGIRRHSQDRTILHNESFALFKGHRLILLFLFEFHFAASNFDRILYMP